MTIILREKIGKQTITVIKKKLMLSVHGTRHWMLSHLFYWKCVYLIQIYY